MPARNSPADVPCETELLFVIGYAARHADELLLRPDRSQWRRVSSQVTLRCKSPKVCEAAERLGELIEATVKQEGLLGQVRSFDAKKGFGFIDHRGVDEALFFHRDDLRDEGVEILLTEGDARAVSA